MSDPQKYQLLVIGGSAGSLSVVLQIAPHFKSRMKMAVILVFHRKQSDDSTLLEVLATRTGFNVREAEDKDEIVPGTIYVVPADYHLLVEKDKTITLDDSEKVNFSRPSIDVTFESAADVFGESLVCMLLSGANADGVHGLEYAKRRGSLIIVQDPEWAEVPYMPAEALKKVAVDILLSPHNLSAAIGELYGPPSQG